MTATCSENRIEHHDPQDVLDYGWNYVKWLNGDTVTASTWTSNPAGLTINSPVASFDTTTTTVWLSGGTLGEGYTVTNHITTAAGRQKDTSFSVVVQSR